MLLNEILDVKLKNHPKDTMMKPSYDTEDFHNDHEDKAHSLYKKLHKKQIVGSGIEAVVFQSSRVQDAGTVTKWLRNQRSDYTKNATMQYLIQSQQQNSTYAPKVYSVTQYKRPNGLYEYSIQMEKLAMTLGTYIHRYQSDPIMVRQILSQIFKQSYVDKYIKEADFLTDIFTTFESDTDMPILDNLRKYLTFVETIPQIWTDVHDENIMVRLTSVGPQLVITDPVSGDLK